MRLPLLACLLSSAGCFLPQPVVRLHPDSPDVVWLSGRAIVGRQMPGYKLAVAFDHLAGGKVAMRLEVENDGPNRLDVDPARMSFRTCNPSTVCGLRRPVVDPEEALLALDEAHARERAAQSTRPPSGRCWSC